MTGRLANSHKANKEMRPRNGLGRFKFAGWRFLPRQFLPVIPADLAKNPLFIGVLSAGIAAA
jgi:hypothetical protein